MSEEYENFIERTEGAPDSTEVISIVPSDPQPSPAEPVTPFGEPGTADDLPDIQP